MLSVCKESVTRLFFALFLLFLVSFPGGGSAQGQEELPTGGESAEGRIGKIFAAFDNTRSPGCAVGVWADGGLEFARGYGMANLDFGLAITPRTIFRTGSVSKQFTAAVVTLLSREGFFSLDDGVRQHFPELPELYEPVTVRHLLHHTSGIRDYLELMGMKGLGDEATYSEEDVVALLARQQDLNFSVGTAYRYSNSGYLLLSRLVERATGQTLRWQAQRLIFGPLGMRNTHFHDNHREIVPNRASGYGAAAAGDFFLDQTTLDIVGDGGVFTSIEDISLWMANFWTQEVGDEGWLREMETRAVLENGDTVDYALGLRHGEHRGLPTVGHGGAFVGYRAATLRYPSEGVAIMALCNFAEAEPSAYVEGVGAVWLEDRLAPMPEPTPVSDAVEPAPGAPQAAAPLTGAEEERLLGDYYSQELDATYRIFREEGKLVLDLNGAEILSLQVQGDNVVRAGWLTLRYEGAQGPLQEFRVGSGRAGGVLFVRK